MDSKLPAIGTTIFTVMSQLAADHGAINLSQGYPDFDPPARLRELVSDAIAAGRNQYPPMTGVPALRQAIADKLSRLYGVTVDPDREVTVTSGATEALFVAIQATVGHGDEVIVFDPAYDSYEPAVTLAGGRTVHVPLALPHFGIDFDRLAGAITDRTRLIIVNTPHNPCGSLVTAGDIERLAGLVDRHGLYCVSDEVYEHMVFDGAAHRTLAGHPLLRERTFVVSSFGKTYHATGWKVAYCVAPPALSTEFRKVHQFVTFTTHTPTQWAIAQYMTEAPGHLLALPAFYQAKRDLFCSLLADSGFRIAPSAGTYFQLADYSDLSRDVDTDFARFLTTEIGVAAIPVSVFYQNPPEQRIVRFCFAKEDSTLREAASRLRTVSRR